MAVSLRRLYEVLLERYGSSMVSSVFASDFDGYYARDSSLSVVDDRMLVTLGEEVEEYMNDELGGFLEGQV